MASQNFRSPSVGVSDSGYETNSNSRTPSTINPKYACYWLETCQGTHEQVGCRAWKTELSGKLGIYYSPRGVYKTFEIDEINQKSLRTNPTGSVLFNLLIYRYLNDQLSILFVMKWLGDRVPYRRSRRNEKRLKLTFVSSQRYVKNEIAASVVRRALQTITHHRKFIDDPSPFLKRFLFVNANVVYPIKLSQSEADLLSRNFLLDSEIESVQWIPLEEIRRNLRPDVIEILPGLDDHLSQINCNAADHQNINVIVGSEQYELDGIAAFLLACIERMFGFDEFV